jgi:hypothetical protein
MNHTKDCIAVVISAPGLPQRTLEQATSARKLVQAKVKAAQEVVSVRRYEHAQQLLTMGMRILFHQGGAPSHFDGKVPGVGRLIAAGYLQGMWPLGNTNQKPDAALLETTKAIFPGWDLGGWLRFEKVNPVPNPPLTKAIIGRPPKPNENYIVVCPDDPTYDSLLRVFESAYP